MSGPNSTEYNRLYRLNNHAKLVARDNERYADNKDAISREQRDHYANFPELFRTRSRVNRSRRSPEEVKADRQANADYWGANGDRILSQRRGKRLAKNEAVVREVKYQKRRVTRMQYLSNSLPGTRDKEIEAQELREAVTLFKQQGGVVTRTESKKKPPGPRLAKPKLGT